MRSGWLPPNLLRIGKSFQAPVTASKIRQRFTAGRISMNGVADDDGVVSAWVDGIHGAFDKGDCSLEHRRSGILDAVG